MSRVFLLATLLACCSACSGTDEWSNYERGAIDSLRLDNVSALPVDLSNAAVGNASAIELGRALFSDVRLSQNGAVACATCHRPDYYFSDDRPRSRGLGLTQRHTPSLLGIAHSRWFYWDGRRDSLWAQALTPIEHPREHGFSRSDAVGLLLRDSNYATLYARAFSTAPSLTEVDRTFSNLGKALAAFESTLMPGAARFDLYATALAVGRKPVVEYSAAEKLGLRLFIGKAQCISCHNGPLFSNHEFHNVGTGLASDLGRFQGLVDVEQDPFNCLAEFSAAPASWCALAYAKKYGAELKGAFKVPSLRNVGATAPYMHDGRYADLAAVVAHYVRADELAGFHSELTPLDVTNQEQEALVAFLETLTQLEGDGR